MFQHQFYLTCELSSTSVFSFPPILKPCSFSRDKIIYIVCYNLYLRMVLLKLFEDYLATRCDWAFCIFVLTQWTFWVTFTHLICCASLGCLYYKIWKCHEAVYAVVHSYELWNWDNSAAWYLFKIGPRTEPFTCWRNINGWGTRHSNGALGLSTSPFHPCPERAPERDT